MPHAGIVNDLVYYYRSEGLLTFSGALTSAVDDMRCEYGIIKR